MDIFGKSSVLTPVIADKNRYGARHVGFDIETGYADSQGVKLSQSFWKAPRNIKDKKALKKREKQFREKTKRNSALLDSAPIGVVSLVTERQKAIFYCVKPKRPFSKLRGVSADLHQCADERRMMEKIGTWLDKVALPNTIVIGHNIFGFDLPKMRGAFVRHRLKLPKLINPESRYAGVECYDTMLKFRHFSTERANDRFISHEEMISRLDLPRYKDKIRGEQVPEYLKRGKVAEVAMYCYLDTISTYQAFKIMTGQ